MFGPIKRTLCSRATRTTSACSSCSPISAKPEGMSTAPGTPFAPHSATAPATSGAGMQNTATSTSPGTSMTLA